MQRQSGLVTVETDVANFRDLVQRLTGLPNDAVDAQCYQKRVHRQHRRRSNNKLRQRRLQQKESCASVRILDLVDSSSKRRREFQLPTQQKREFHGAERGVFQALKDSSSEGECGEVPELLALFPPSSSNLKA